MEFCIMSPIAGLERYATLSKTHLLLPQITDDRYWKFYLERKIAGDFIILDNGAYEGQENWKRLVECLHMIEPDVCVLPDYLCQSWKKTYKESINFLDKYYYGFPRVRWMYVPQAESGDIIGWVNSLCAAMEDERIKWIGLPRALAYSIIEDPLIRVKAAFHIHKRWPNIKLHALGMVKGSVKELNALRELGCVNSIDSNAPVWRGICGWSMVRSMTPWNEVPCDYNAALPPNNEVSILENLEACGVSTLHDR